MISCAGSLESRFLTKRILCIIGIGLAIRFAVAGLMTYTYDVHSWALIISNFEAGNGLYDVNGYNYAPPWGYILGAFSKVAEFFGLDLFGIRSTEFLFVEDYKWYFSAFVPSESFAIAFECLLAAFDILAGYAIYALIEARSSDRRKAENGFAIWFLCPFVIAVSCVGGMFDAISALLTCLCIYFAMKENYWLAGIMLGMAASFKLFPGILAFVLIGYVVNRSADRKEGLENVMRAGIAAMLTFLVLFMPQILDGTFTDSFAFLTSRASSDLGSGLSSLERAGTLAFYSALIVVSFFLGRAMSRYAGGDKDKALLALAFINLALLFLYPATPQYILLLTPLLIIHMLDDKRYRIPFAILCVGTTVFVLAATAADFMTVAQFSDAMSASWVADAIRWSQSSLFGGVCLMDILYYVGGAMQYIGTLSILAVMFTKRRLIETISPHSEPLLPFCIRRH